MSSGRPVAAFGWVSTIRARLGSLRDRHLDLLDGAGGGGRGDRHGVRLEADDGRAHGHHGRDRVGPGEHRLGGLDTLGPGHRVDGVGDQPRAGLDRQPRRHLLADHAAGDENRCGRSLLDERREDLGLRHDEVVERVGAVVDVDLLGAVLGQGDGGDVGTGPDVDRRRLTEPAGDRQQLGRGLADLAVGVVDQNENFGHGGYLLLDRSGSEELLGGQELGELGASVALVGDDLALGPRRPLAEGEHLRPRAGQPDLGRVHAEVGERPRLDRLLLGRHDPLERGVARLVDLVGHGHQRRHRRLDGLRGGVPVATDAQPVAVDGELAGIRHLGQAQALGEHRRDDPHRAVGRGHPGEHEVVVPDLADRLGEDEGGARGVGAVDGVVTDVHALVRAHLQGLLDGVGGLGRAHREHRDLSPAGLDQLQRLLDGILVQLGQQALDAGPVRRLVGLVEGEVPLGVRYVLHAHDDVHACLVLFSVSGRWAERPSCQPPGAVPHRVPT